MEAKQIILDFIEGKTDIALFIECAQRDERIFAYLQSIVDDVVNNQMPPKRRTVVMKNVNQNKPFQLYSYIEEFIPELVRQKQLLHSLPVRPVPTVKEKVSRHAHQTAYGATSIYSIVADIYYQMDQSAARTTKYADAYSFSLEVLPQYVGGAAAEGYISSRIIPKYPESMKKTERKKRIKEEIRQAFPRDCKGYPSWIQEPEWPMGSDGLPMVYTGQKKYEAYTDYFFRGNTLDEKKTVRQLW